MVPFKPISCMGRLLRRNVQRPSSNSSCIAWNWWKGSYKLNAEARGSGDGVQETDDDDALASSKSVGRRSNSVS